MILVCILLLNISHLKNYSIQVTFKLSSSKKSTPTWSFINKLNFRLLKEWMTKRDISKIKNITLGELSIPLALFSKLVGKTIIILLLFFYSQYFG